MATRQLELQVGQRLRSGAISSQETRHLFNQLLAARDPDPSIRTIDHLLATFVGSNTSSNSYPTVYSLFNRLNRERGIFPDVFTYGILIKSCAQANPVRVVLPILGRFLRDGHRVNPVIFSPILRGLCWENRISEAASMVLDKMPRLECLPSVVSYSILTKGLCSMGKTDLALQLLFKMDKHGGECAPDVITYSTVIDGLCKEDKLEKAFVLYKYMHSAKVIPNTVTYTSLIDGLCKKGAVDKAIEWLQTMASKCHKPNTVTFTALIDGLCKNGEFKKAMELVHNLISKGWEPNVVACNAIMDAFCKAEHTVQAEDLLHAMVSMGCEPNVVTYNTLIDGMCKIGEIGKAENLLDEMISRGLKPDVWTYNTLMDGFCRTDNLDKMKKLLDDMVSKGLMPDVVTCSTVLNALCKKGAAEKAEEYFFCMISEGLTLGTILFNTLIDGFCKKGLMPNAVKLFQVMLLNGMTPDIFTYTSLMHGYSKSGKWREVMKVFRELVDQGYLPSDTYRAVIDSLCKHGQSKEAHKVLDLMVGTGLKHGIIPYNSFLLGNTSGGTLSIVMNIIDSMLPNKLPPDFSINAGLIDAYTKNEKVDEAMSMCLLNRMKHEKVNPDLIGRILSDIRNAFPNGKN